MTLIELENLKKALDKLKIDKTIIECEFFERLHDLTCENGNLKQDLVKSGKCTTTPKGKFRKHMHSFLTLDVFMWLFWAY